MRVILFTALIGLTVASCTAQSTIQKNGKNQVLDSVQEKLSKDTVSFNQFVLLGKCHCMDQIDSTARFQTVFDELFYLWTPFSRLIGNVDGKNALMEYHTSMYKTLYPQESAFLRSKDEVIRYNSNSMIICDRIYSKRNKLWEHYVQFIMRDGVIMGLPHHLEEYLNNSSVVITNEGW